MSHRESYGGSHPHCSLFDKHRPDPVGGVGSSDVMCGLAPSVAHGSPKEGGGSAGTTARRGISSSACSNAGTAVSKSGEIMVGVEPSPRSETIHVGLTKKLASMVGHKNHAVLHSLGGQTGLLAMLHVNPDVGLSNAPVTSSTPASPVTAPRPGFIGYDDADGADQDSMTYVEGRRLRYGRNELPPSKLLTFLDFVRESLDDRTMQILISAACVSLVIGMTTPDPRTGEVDRSTGWIEGFAILLSVAIVILVSSLNNYRKQGQFAELSADGDQLRPVVVRRNGGTMVEIRDSDLVVGDVVLISQGMQLSFDAVLLDATSVVCDEGNVTGENDDVAKHVTTDPFLISGSSVQEGSTDGVALVLAVGEHCFSGEITMAIRSAEKKNTPLQVQLEEMAERIGKFGLAAAVVTFLALFVKEVYAVAISGGRFFAMKFFENITTAIAIVVVAVPEGLPLSVTIALAYSMRRMLAEGNLVRHLAACETMGSATVLCSDKTGTLTLPTMKLKRLFVEGHDYANLASDEVVTVGTSEAAASLLLDCIALNAGDSGASVMRNKTSEAMLPLCTRLRLSTPSTTPFQYPLRRVEQLVRDVNCVVRFPFNSNWKQSATIVRMDVAADGHGPTGSTGLASSIAPCAARPSGGGSWRAAGGDSTWYRQFVAGAGETVLEQCSGVLGPQGVVVPLTPELRSHYSSVLIGYSRRGLRVISCAYVDVCPPSGASGEELSSHGMPTQPFPDGMTLIGIVGLEESIRPEVVGAIAKCNRAGVRVIMITGDSVYTALNIAERCGLLGTMTAVGGSQHSAGGCAGSASPLEMTAPPYVVPSAADVRGDRATVGGSHEGIGRAHDPLAPLQLGGVVLDGPTFRAMEDERVMNVVVPNIVVLARATPLDKKRLVQLFKQKFPLAVVAVTGDGTNDAPALKLSDVGFAMNSGSDVAKRASDIILLTNNFDGMVKATMWGRSVKDNIRKFLQFQLTVNIVACIVSFCGALMNDQNLSPLKPVQLLWLNLIMDTLAALALATELPCEDVLLSRPPELKSNPVISSKMWFVIATQSSFQLVCQILLLRHAHRLFAAPRTRVAAYDRPLEPTTIPQFGEVHLTVFFNAFVWMQIFNFFNARLLNDDERFFAHFCESSVLLTIVAVIAAVQVVIVQVGGVFMSTTPLSLSQWVFCVGVGSLSLLVGAATRWCLVNVVNPECMGLRPRLLVDGSGSGSRPEWRGGTPTGRIAGSQPVWQRVVQRGTSGWATMSHRVSRWYTRVVRGDRRGELDHFL